MIFFKSPQQVVEQLHRAFSSVDMDYSAFKLLCKTYSNNKYSYLVIDLSRDYESGLKYRNYIWPVLYLLNDIAKGFGCIKNDTRCTWKRYSGARWTWNRYSAIHILFGVYIGVTRTIRTYAVKPLPETAKKEKLKRLSVWNVRKRKISLSVVKWL